jgi:hypothetical protein
MANDRPAAGERGKRTKKVLGRSKGGTTKPLEPVHELPEQKSESEKEVRPMDEKRDNTASEAGKSRVTEKPVPSQRKISKYVASVDDATGYLIKIEKLDEKTGEPRALSTEECAAASAYAAPYYADYAASLYGAMSSPATHLHHAYLKAISDYVKMFSQKR